MRIVPFGHSATVQLFDHAAAGEMPVLGKARKHVIYKNYVTHSFGLDRPRLVTLGLLFLNIAGHTMLVRNAERWLEEHESRRTAFTYAGEIESKENFG